jgi:NAD-dependent SIR2 family protein deacetylase
MTTEHLFKKAAELIAAADALVIGAGAGMGVDSGLPDFRGNEGFWKAYPALAKSQLDFTDVANPRTFEKDPALAWGFYGHRLDLYRKTVPHEGFSILRKWGDNAKQGAHVFTSNVDGQFQKAGFAETQIHECHGSIHHLQCMVDCVSGVWSARDFHPDVDVENCRLRNEPPPCLCCGSIARPNILMFGDWNWLHERMEQQRRQEKAWFQGVVNSLANVVVVELGAGIAIPSVRQYCQRISKEFGARIIRINPREFDVPSKQDVGLPMGSLEALRGIDLALTHLAVK